MSNPYRDEVAYDKFVAETAETCQCCPLCGDVPCTGCLSGGMCDASSRCRCLDEPEDKDPDDDFFSY